MGAIWLRWNVLTSGRFFQDTLAGNSPLHLFDLSALRETPPTSLGGLAVLGVDDLALGSADLLPTEGLRYRLADGARVIVRPSGTEPKIKCYLEVVVPVEHTAPDENTASADAQRDAVDAARIAASGRLDALRNDIKAAAGI